MLRSVFFFFLESQCRKFWKFKWCPSKCLQYLFICWPLWVQLMCFHSHCPLCLSNVCADWHLWVHKSIHLNLKSWSLYPQVVGSWCWFLCQIEARLGPNGAASVRSQHHRGVLNYIRHLNNCFPSLTSKTKMLNFLVRLCNSNSDGK